MTTPIMTVQELLALPHAVADKRPFYGNASQQFGDLYLPSKTSGAKSPLVIFIHGGCWLAAYGLEHASAFCAALRDSGLAVWSLEYRRVGNVGGGWPGTFLDVARGVDFARSLAETYPVDLERTIVMGHSAGGHLALWAAARHRLAAESELDMPRPLPVKGVVSLAGIPDLQTAVSAQICGDAAAQLIGEDDDGTRYRDGSPQRLLPLGVPQAVINGRFDDIVSPTVAEAYAAQAEAAGDPVALHILPDAGHYELVTPNSVAWDVVKTAVWRMLQ